MACYSDVDVSAWTTQVKGKNSFGSPTVLILSEGFPPRVALSRRDEPRGTIPFKLNFDHNLDVQITLTQDQIAFLERVDRWALVQALANAEEWFGRAYSAEELAAMYVPCLRTHERYPPKLRSKIVPTGPYSTRVVYLAADTRRSGWGLDFVNPLLGADGWRGNEVRGVVEFRRVWVVGKKFGLAVSYSDLVVVEKEREAPAADFPEFD